jgi:hypothetical protein
MRRSLDRSSRHEQRALRALGVVFTVVVTAFGAPAVAQATEHDKALCVDSYKNAQVQRKNGALKQARESLLVCLSDKCPSVMQPDCTRWLTEVEAALPSVSFAAKGVDGKDVVSVRVTMDGQFLTDTLDGRSINVDPGSHTVRFEYAAEPPIEQTISVREGEKARVVGVSWMRPRRLGAAETARNGSGRPAGAWVAGGVGVAALATFGALALHGLERRSDLEKECFGRCRQDQVDSIKTELTVGDAALGVGIVALGVSAVLFLTSSSSSTSPATRGTARHRTFVTFDVAPRREGGAARFAARF